MDRDGCLERTADLLINWGIVAPLSADADDTRNWLDCELSLLIEGHCHQIVDSNSFLDRTRDDWKRRLHYSKMGFGNVHSKQFRSYWLVDHGRRVGIFGIRWLLTGWGDVEISSLYVRPEARGRRFATRALDAACTAAAQSGGEGIRIATNWSWQRAVAFYAHRGFWVHNWKHSLVFCRSVDLSPYRVDIRGANATFLVMRHNTWTPLLEAENRGQFLGWTELPAYRSPSYIYKADGTFALHLVINGWPLVRSAEFWKKRHRHADMGMSEGLAYKIAVFGNLDRQQGYDVQTPTIPGLDYGSVWAD